MRESYLDLILFRRPENSRFARIEVTCSFETSTLPVDQRVQFSHPQPRSTAYLPNHLYILSFIFSYNGPDFWDNPMLANSLPNLPRLITVHLSRPTPYRWPTFPTPDWCPTFPTSWPNCVTHSQYATMAHCCLNILTRLTGYHYWTTPFCCK